MGGVSALSINHLPPPTSLPLWGREMRRPNGPSAGEGSPHH